MERRKTRADKKSNAEHDISGVHVGGTIAGYIFLCISGAVKLTWVPSNPWGSVGPSQGFGRASKKHI